MKSKKSLLYYIILTVTGKSMSEALILASTNPQYDDRLFIELQVQYMKTASSEHGENMSSRYHPRFFDQVGHQTTLAYIENKHFFTK